MKVEIDYKNKTVKLLESVNLEQFIETLQSTLPNWKEYKLLFDQKIITSSIKSNPFLPKITYGLDMTDNCKFEIKNV